MPNKATLKRLKAELISENGRAESRKDANRNLEDILEEILALADEAGLDFDDSLDAARRYYAARKQRAATPASAAGAGQPGKQGSAPDGDGLPPFEE